MIRYIAPLIILALGPALCAQLELPPGFVAESIDGGWQSPVGLAFIDEHLLLVAERDGRVWLVEDDQRKNLVLDISSETLVNGDRGMLGIAVDPHFLENGWLYLLLVVDPTGGDESDGLAFSRLIKIRTEFDAEGNLNTIPGTRVHLLGDQWSSGITSCHLSHTIGTIRFLSDGSLVLTSGDNAHFDATDAGGLDPGCFEPGRTPIEQDVGAYRSQRDDSLCGKVLRIDPETGWGLADNPGYDGDPESIVSRIYARGLRNPFRFTLLPGSGERETIFIGDVGWNRWEEIDVVLFGGENFGWPCFEGDRVQSQYVGLDPLGLCPGVAADHTAPILAWNHTSPGPAGFAGNCVSGLAFYTGEDYPPLYHDRLFFCDFGRNWLKAARLGEDLEVTNVVGFGRNLGGPVDLSVDPASGDLVVARLSPPGIFRLRYVGSNQPPVAIATATPTWGGVPLTVSLSAADSFDPEGDALEYQWDFGDGTAPSTEGEVTHEYLTAENRVARLTVFDDEERVDSAEVLISPGNSPPTILSLVTSLPNGVYVTDEIFRAAGAAQDAEDVDHFTPHWSLDLVHDHHTHPNWASAEGLVVNFLPDAHDAEGDNHFELTFRVTDSRGLSDERTISLFDAQSLPRAHLVDVPADHLRAGQAFAPTGHVDFALGTVLARKPTLTWHWGDGTSDVFADVSHHQDTSPTHMYLQAGDFVLKLVAELGDLQTIDSTTIHVGTSRPALAIFAPIQTGRWVPPEQQPEIFDGLSQALARSASEVKLFQLGDGQQLAEWMNALLADQFQDVLLLVDFVPDSIFTGEEEGSLLERWIENGNGVVWTGQMPFSEAITDEGATFFIGQGSLGADRVLDASNTVVGSGLQQPTALAARDLPALQPYVALRALLYGQLGFGWQITALYADGLAGSDAIEVRHEDGGFYAQFLCTDADVPRAEVLVQYLETKFRRLRTKVPVRPR